MLVTTTSGGLPYIITDDWANGVSLNIESDLGEGIFEELYWFDEAPASEPEYALGGWTIVDPSGRIHSLIFANSKFVIHWFERAAAFYKK